MPYLTTEQKATLNQLLVDNELTAVDEFSAANKLNEPTYITIAGQSVPKTFTWPQVMGCMTPSQALAVLNLPAVTTIITHVNNQDRSALAFWVQGLRYTEIITDVEVGKIQTLFSQTETSPDRIEEGPSLFAQGFPGFRVEIGGAGYVEKCHAELIVEARGQ